MAFDAFSPFGMRRFSSKPSKARAIYLALRDNFGNTFDKSFGGVQQARLYAIAMTQASAEYQLERAANNRNPAKATELLGKLEQDYQVVPAYNATLPQRRAYLAAYAKIVKGNSKSAISGLLATLLGSDFVSYDVTPASAIVSWPSSPGDVGVFAGPGTKKKAFTIQTFIATIGSPVTVPFSVLGGSEPPIAGETYCVDPDPRHAAEKITIAASTATTITATFTRAHESGVVAVRPHPLWMSNQRYSRVVLKFAAARDPEKRRKVNELMARALRGVSQWCIVSDQGRFHFGSATAARLGCTRVLA